MRKLRRHVPVALALTFLLPSASLLTSCGILKRLLLKPRPPLAHHGKPVSAQQPLLAATLDELIERIAKIYGAINSFQATITMTPSVGSVAKGQISDVAADIRAFILFRKPDHIRIKALTPLVGTPLFDMVSDGTNFRFLMNSKNLFFEGLNSAPAVSKNKLENLRPAVFLSSMLIMLTDSETETPVLTNVTDEESAFYVIHFIRKLARGDLRVSREVYFDRLDLTITRQIVFDDIGDIVSDTNYAKWMPYDSVVFPSHIEIQRPKDEYGVVMDIVQMEMNKALTDATFVLTPPEGAQIQTIGAASPVNQPLNPPVNQKKPERK
jgi:outer membrane lipoprotein-sorting protein